LKKEKIRKLIADAKAFSTYEERLTFLKDKFVGETCYVLGCGPSLKDVDKEKLIEEAKDTALFTIKQSYFSFKEHVDFHFFNTNNYKNYPDNTKVMFVGCSDWNPEIPTRANIWKLQQVDICTSVAGTVSQGNLANEPPMSRLQYTEGFDLSTYTFDETGLNRKWGAGIMYELVLYFAYHLGFSEIKTIGWDYSDPNSAEPAQHFYSEEARLKTINPCLPAYLDEMLDSINLAAHFDNFFKENKVNLKVHESGKCFLPNQIERYVL